QARLAEDLEAVADSKDEPAVGGQPPDWPHYRCEPGERTRAQVVAVRKAAGKDHGAHVGKLAVDVPDGDGVRSEPFEREGRVTVVVRAREGDDRDASLGLGPGHASPTSSIS